MKTNPQLEIAYDFVQYTGQNIFLTGKAGTGKTTFLKSLKERSPKRMIVVAPTGVAAINAGGVTIHSFFQLSFAPQIGQESKLNREQRFNKTKINIIRSLDLLVIDEISMVRADILDAIDSTMRRFKNRRKPFGGAQVLMIGDLQQLAPVIKQNEWDLLRTTYDTAFFFSSKVLKQTPFVSIELTEVFRQQDNDFISILNKVRDNTLDESALAALNKRYLPDFTPADEEGYITLCTHNAHAQLINDSKLKNLPSSVEKFKARVKGNFPEYSYPTNFDLMLKIGAQVMFVKNDPEPEKRFYNGKIGQVSAIDDDVVYVQCPDEEEEMAVTPLLWENVKYTIDKTTAEIKEEVEGSFLQHPLKLAWAITIHKSQGLTFEKAIIDAEASFAHGQVYVALSRCKTLEGMVLKTQISKSSIINDGTVAGFIQGVEENQPGEKELLEARLSFQKEQLTELFRFYRTTYLFDQITKLIADNKGSFSSPIIDFFDSAKEKVQQEITEVAGKFYQQITTFLRVNPNIEQNQKLQERIKKASAYFGEKVKTLITDGLDALDLDIDNKAIKKQFKRYYTDLYEEADGKLAGFEECLEGFNIKRMLDARAKVMLQNSSVTPKKQKAREISDVKNIPHTELYEQLRAYRLEKASELALPVYMIFSQKSLIELVNYLPVDSKSLNLINGLGKRKVEQFGADILHCIQHYCTENNIERGTIPLQTSREKKPKVDTKKISFELYQSGKTVPEIAEERALSVNTIENHLAHYIRLGEIDVLNFIKKEKLDKVLGYFKSHDDKSFTNAKTYFGDEVSYGDLRMALSYLESLSKN